MIKRYCLEFDRDIGIQNPDKPLECAYFYETLEIYYEDKLIRQSYEDMLTEAIEEISLKELT